MDQATVKPKREMLNYINVFRGLAILLIVAGHTMQFGTKGTWINDTAFEILTGGTALFIFISGFLFQHLSDKFEYKTYLKNSPIYNNRNSWDNSLFYHAGSLRKPVCWIKSFCSNWNIFDNRTGS